ncbi:hypothetical protein IFM89_009599 [Coptis chinensis]|uniref:Uncharacterized protein n=1 Tax=Coptis chinensis TaxID=261450 RepID=A0A835INJ9_9MAGN|nr:hypothetical protein IFM89_009599 [Coptis chinensis]
MDMTTEMKAYAIDDALDYDEAEEDTDDRIRSGVTLLKGVASLTLLYFLAFLIDWILQLLWEDGNGKHFLNFNPMIMNLGTAVDECALMDLGLVGSILTWCNNQEGLARVYKRLDRALCNSAWRVQFPRGDHRPYDIFHQLDMLWPGLLGTSKYEFAKTYCEAKMVQGAQGKVFQEGDTSSMENRQETKPMANNCSSEDDDDVSGIPKSVSESDVVSIWPGPRSGPAGFESIHYDQGNESSRATEEASRALFMSAHFVFPPSDNVKR